MKILDNGVLRDLTEEEIKLFFSHEEEEEATEADYLTALERMGVNTNA